MSEGDCAVPQGLKPALFVGLTARLKPRPTQNIYNVGFWCPVRPVCLIELGKAWAANGQLISRKALPP